MNVFATQVLEAASALCHHLTEEDWHGIISAAESAGCLDAFKKEGIELMGKLSNLAQAVQDYES